MQHSPVAAPPLAPEHSTTTAPTTPSSALPPASHSGSPQRLTAVHDGSGSLAAIQSLSYIIVVAIFTVTFSLQPFRIPSASMEPTLLVGDFLLVNKEEPPFPGLRIEGILDPFPATPIRRGDIIVFHYPVDPTLHLVKRVIGLPGDRLRMRNGRVFINDVPLQEPYAIYTSARRDAFRDDFPHLQSTDPDVSARWWSEMQHLVQHGVLTIPQGKYFVLGDNRNDSEDSRYWGLVPRASIVGEPLLVYFSLRNGGGGAELARDTTGTAAHRPPHDTLGGLARWHRVFHVIH